MTKYAPFHYFTFIQINCVVMKGLNDDEICDFVQLTEHKVCPLRTLQIVVIIVLFPRIRHWISDSLNTCRLTEIVGIFQSLFPTLLCYLK